LPEALAGKRFYEPKEIGFEKEIRERLEKMKKSRRE
jgi:replication-associated recombination protein RarA